MSDFKIRVGGVYSVRGNPSEVKVKILGLEEKTEPMYNPSAPYLGDDGEVYSENGRFNGQTFESEYDLIEEAHL